tara:strand:- start:12507 stop:13178 length:672 start_codon:yes stop_codon:yes gene_type:complete
MATTTLTVSENNDNGRFFRNLVSIGSDPASCPGSFNGITQNYTNLIGANYDDEEIAHNWAAVYFRFQSVAIDQGTTISSAFLKSHITYLTGTGDFLIAAIDTDDAPQPTAAFQGNKTSYTTAQVTYSSIAVAAPHTSPDIKTVIQEIVDRAGWSSGNDITIVVYVNSVGASSSRLANFGRLADSKAAQLEIETPGGGSTRKQSLTMTDPSMGVQGLGNNFTLE